MPPKKKQLAQTEEEKEGTALNNKKIYIFLIIYSACQCG